MRVTANFKNFELNDVGTKVWEVDSWAWAEKGVAMVLRTVKEGVVTSEVCIPLDAVYFVYVDHEDISVATDSLKGV